ncbi:hypothetical protein Y032_0306g2003 [Ancylostoma ceylanicum]|uniref:Glucuronosyltransferase n=1 Tax=Ancylostoma ceylanicum TaxID=53326 RepID=A0A016S314_9BILA|nr:hypothetical protein Y032_0306g2003 [Ancylostoma ceylanicum]
MIRVVFWLVLFTIVDAGKILVYSPSISYSHLISNGRIADALAKAGHDVVMFIPEYSSSTTKFIPAKHAKIVRMNNFNDLRSSSGSRYDDDTSGGEDWVTEQTTMSFALRLDFEYTLTAMCREKRKISKDKCDDQK